MAIPENRKIPAEQLKGLLDPDPNQIIEINGIGTIATIYKEATGTVTFNTSKVQGSSASPQYNFLNVSNTNPKDLNNAVVKHSSLVVPAVLVPNKPSSPLDVYVDQATMTADFANQVSGSHYAYTGSTSMWLYDGTATDSIANYTEVVEVTGWEEWGTKPAYLIVQGDAYLVGEDNINTLSFVFYELIKISGVSYHDTVICTVTAHTGMNRDLTPPDLNLLIEHIYSGTGTVLLDSISNLSLYGEEFSTTIINPDEAQWVASGLSLGNGGDNSVGVRARREVLLPDNYDQFFTSEQFTLIVKKELRNTGTANDRGLVGNLNNNLGFRCIVLSNFGLRIQIAGTSLNSNTGVISENSGQWCLGFTWEKNSSVLHTAQFFRKSFANSIIFEQIGTDVTNGNDRSMLGGLNVLELDRTIAGASMRGSIESGFFFINKKLTPAQIELIMNELDPTI